MAIRVPIISEYNPAGADKAIASFEQLKTKGEKAQFALKKAALPAAAAFAAVTAAAVKFVAAGEAASTSNARIAQVAESMGLFGDEADVATTRITKLAEAQARLTGVNQDEIKAGQAVLLTFGKLAETAGETGGAFDRATKATIDLAAAGFGSVESNAVQLGKALNDPIKGLSALSRSGVTFTEQEKEKIKTLVESGQTLEAQGLILTAIETQVGGVAEATANSSDKMKVAFSQASQAIGLALLPAFEKLSAIAVVVSTWIAENKGLVIGFGAVIGGVAGAVLALNAAMKVYVAIKKAAAIAQLAFNVVLGANPITLVVLAIAGLVAGIVLAYRRFEGFRNVVHSVFQAVKTAVGFTINVIKGYFETLTGFYKGLFNGLAKLWNNTVGKLSFTAPEWLKYIGLGMIAGKTFEVPKIPLLADGGIVTRPTLAMIGEGGGPEAVIPLDRLGGMGTTINIYSTIADETLPERIVQALRTYNRTTGPVRIQVA